MTWFRVQSSGFRVQGPGFRVQGPGFAGDLLDDNALLWLAVAVHDLHSALPSNVLQFKKNLAMKFAARFFILLLKIMLCSKLHCQSSVN